MLNDMAGDQKIQTVRAHGQLRGVGQQIGWQDTALQVRIMARQSVAT